MKCNKLKIIMKFSTGIIKSLVLCTIMLSCASSKPETVPADFKDPEFWKYDASVKTNFDIALKLYMYDKIAWTSSDSVTNWLLKKPHLKEELGGEWFIYQDKDSNYHAVYGKYYANDDRYKPVFHFRLNNQFQVVATDSPVDSQTCLRYARAINKSLPIVRKYVEEKSLKLNWYVLKEPSGRLNVWYLPGQINDSYEVYGGDFKYIFDMTGKQLIDSVWNDNGFKIVRPAVQKRVALMNSNNKYPTVDNIFCALNILRKYNHKLPMVFIVSQQYTSALAFHKDEGYSWIHIDPAKQKKK